MIDARASAGANTLRPGEVEPAYSSLSLAFAQGNPWLGDDNPQCSVGPVSTPAAWVFARAAPSANNRSTT